MSTNPPNRHAQIRREHQMIPGVRQGRTIAAGVVFAATVLALLSFFAAVAFADYEQAFEHFGTTGEAEQLQLAKGIAINTSGAGGVEPGSVYVVGWNDRVVRYGPGEEGEEPPFREAWGWGVGDAAAEFERCGPALITEPSLHTFHNCTPAVPNAPFGGEQAGHFNQLSSVAVDQATGDVYVRSEALKARNKVRHLIEVFTATGTPVGEGFGEEGRESPLPSESIAEGPEKLHEGGPSPGIAVDESGVVYVVDSDFTNGINEIADPSSAQVRVMSYQPEHAGDYEHYVYTGQAHDLSVSKSALGGVDEFTKIAILNDAHLVTTNEESIFEYVSGNATPVCAYLAPGGQIEGMTANQVTGEVFYFTHADHSVHRLGACDAGTGQFTSAQGPIAVSPQTKIAKAEMNALAVNPGLSWGVLRPNGVVYGVDSADHYDLTPEQHGIGDIFVPAKVFAPGVEGENVADTTLDSTVLRATVNPNGFATHYRFQYLTKAAYAAQKSQAESEGMTPEGVEDAAFTGALEAPAGGGLVESGGVGVASAGIGGLVADTEYRFRVIASSECEGSSGPACVTTGEAEAFSTYPFELAGLPDGRAYELVSPAEKYGGEVFPADTRVSSCANCKPPGGLIAARFPMQSTPSGDGLVYMGFPFSPADSAVDNEYLSRRTASGWQTEGLSPASQATFQSGSVIFDTGLTRDLLYQESPQLSADAPTGYANLYMQEAATPGVLAALVATRPPNRAGVDFQLKFAGASPDLSRVFFSANDALTGTTLFAPEPGDPGQFGHDLYEWHEGSLDLVNVLPGNTGVAEGAVFASAQGSGALSSDAHGVSADGSRVFWDADGRLYVRVNGEETLEVSGAASFVTASRSGLEALLSNGKVSRFDDETGVYETTTDLTEGQGGFQGILGSAEEGGEMSRIYYVDTQALVGSGENERHQAAQPAHNNLYLWEAGAPRFIATLGAGDDGGVSPNLYDWATAPVARTAEASPDGRWLAFMSEAPLTAYDNVNAPPACVPRAFATTGPCSEVFLYDAGTHRLICASCNPTGEPPRGPSTLRLVQGAHEWFTQPRYLTDAGRLVFDSGDRLSALDSNGRVEDVYEYEPAGVGTCARAAGCVSLISPGTGSVDSNFLAMDESGANVFFTTRERLVAQDTDELVDVYDAREHGGFASQSETQRTECQGEACQGSPRPPVFATPGSATFSGPGNLLQPLTPAAPVQAKAVSGKTGRARALQKCRALRAKRRRTACERRARKAARKAAGARNGKRGAK